MSKKGLMTEIRLARIELAELKEEMFWTGQIAKYSYLIKLKNQEIKILASKY